jgi:hypothetical protein
MRLGRFSMVLLAPACMAKKNGSAVCSTGRKGPVDGLQICRRKKQIRHYFLASPGSGAASGWSFSIHGCAPVGTRTPLMLLSADGLPPVSCP